MSTVIVKEITDKKVELKGNVTLTDAWQPLEYAIGVSKISVKNRKNIALWIKGLLNDSNAVQVRLKCYPEQDSTDYYFTQIQTIGSSEVTLDAEVFSTAEENIALVVPLGITDLVPFIEIEAKVGTVGATAAVLETILVTLEGID
jgi:hypothetical protein